MKLIVILLLSGVLMISSAQAQEQTALEKVFFDDFTYTGTDDAAFTDHGWIVRSEAGWPGVPGAIWGGNSVTVIDDPDQEDNRLMQMTASVDGDITQQAQLCQQRKFYEGTYATRVRFTDTPETGRDGDQVVETFYLISPLEADLDPDYSELDFEYLPNGGWGATTHILYATTWETFRPVPNWLADNTSGLMQISFEGWHTLVLQVADGEVSYYVDGYLIDMHGEEYYPEVPMALNYNLWFIDGGQLHAQDPREYIEQIDWVYHAADVVLTPEEAEAAVESLRADEVDHVDGVPPTDPPLESPCNF